MNSQGWLGNFLPHEKNHALHLLNSFFHYSDQLAGKLLLTAFRNLSHDLYEPDLGYAEFMARWNDYLAHVYVTFPTGESPSPTDSGYTYARMARQVVGIPEAQIFNPGDAIQVIAASSRPCVLLFVDDFAGTGLQFEATWNRLYPADSGLITFKQLASSGAVAATYLPLLATTFAKQRLEMRVPNVLLRPAHFLSDRYSALNPDGLIWPPSLAASAEDFLRDASQRAGIPDTNGVQSNDWRGIAKLGLTVSIGNAIPDASLPLIYWEENGWIPLKRRS
jgi:hypothetical protein